MVTDGAYFDVFVITLSCDLLICHRNKIGIGDREEEEKQCADSLRSHVVDFLRQEEHCLIDAVKDLPLLLDNRLTAPYSKKNSTPSLGGV